MFQVPKITQYPLILHSFINIHYRTVKNILESIYNLHFKIFSFLYISYIQINSKMVLLHYKKTDHNQFLYEVPGDTLVAEVIDQLVQSIYLLYSSQQYANTTGYIRMCD